MADDPVLIKQIHLDIGPDRPPGSFFEESMDLRNFSAEKAHHIKGMRMERPDMEMFAAFIIIIDPHAHVDGVQFAQTSFVQPFFGLARRWRKAVIMVDRVGDVLCLG